MKNMILILSILFFITGCSDKETKQQESSIYGTWKLTSFVNQVNNSVLVESDFSSSKEITITFNQELKFNGNTGRNTFFGDYYLKDKDKLFIPSGFATTEAGETEWGKFFYGSFIPNYNPQTDNTEFTYEVVKENTLKIFYSEQEYMTFEKM